MVRLLVSGSSLVRFLRYPGSSTITRSVSSTWISANSYPGKKWILEQKPTQVSNWRKISLSLKMYHQWGLVSSRDFHVYGKNSWSLNWHLLYSLTDLDEVCCEDVVDVLQPWHHGGQAVQVLDHHWVIKPSSIASVLPRLQSFFCLFFDK